MKTTLCFTLTLLTFVTLAFVPNSFAQDESPEYVVRVIYFLPNDRKPDPDMDTKLDKLIKELQQFYADQMELHGFGRKTFRFEADENGDAVVHQVNGKFNEAYYQNPSASSWIVTEEIEEQFDMSKNIYLIFLDTSSDKIVNDPVKHSVLGAGFGDSVSGAALMPASFLSFSVAAHELGHTFGLLHGRYRKATEAADDDAMINSFCAAEWLDKNRYFNLNQNTFNLNSNIKMLPPTLAAPPATIRVQFEVSDPDGLHQAQLYTKHLDGDNLFISCQRLSGKSETVDFEFNVTEEILKKETIGLRIVDAHGNHQRPIYFPIDITALLPLDETISIPDPNLAKTIRERLGLASKDTITQQDMLGLLQLDVRNVPIRELTGLEHAINLRLIRLYGTEITDISLLAKLTNLDWVDLSLNNRNIDISPLGKLTNLERLSIYNALNIDISPLGKLTNLQHLSLDGDGIIDISPLGKLTNLQHLSLDGDGIIDISPLGKLTNLKGLSIYNALNVDISPLEKLTNLEVLRLAGNISDITSLTGLTNLEKLSINSRNISDITSLTGLTNLEELTISVSKISDISALAGLTNLRILNMMKNQITDIDPLEGLTRLEKLYLSDNKISDISALAGMTNLADVQISRNRISVVPSLAGLTNLRLLYLQHNQISDVRPFAGLVNLAQLNLVDNPIKNKEPLLELLRKNPDVKIYLKNNREPLPVTLSRFRAEHTNAGVILKWTTESEVDNAGFNIYRSETKEGEFKVVNPTMVQGAGTTGERNEYTWTDTTAKPNTVYYYRIEDVSHAGVREQLATVRLRGLVSASGKLTTRWADLKAEY